MKEADPGCSADEGGQIARGAREDHDRPCLNEGGGHDHRVDRGGGGQPTGTEEVARATPEFSGERYDLDLFQNAMNAGVSRGSAQHLRQGNGTRHDRCLSLAGLEHVRHDRRIIEGEFRDTF
ncbi:hypothetical protein GCM10027176_01970 [Actinoallomurus bryophytorum]